MQQNICKIELFSFLDVAMTISSVTSNVVKLMLKAHHRMHTQLSIALQCLRKLTQNVPQIVHLPLRCWWLLLIEIHVGRKFM